MSYTVYYKKTNSIFWKTIKNVKGDGFVEDGYSTDITKNIRWFILEDETRFEIDCENMIFKFSKERFYMIEKQMKKEINGM